MHAHQLLNFNYQIVMILQNCGVIISLVFYLLVKIVCVIVNKSDVMYNKRVTTLTSIPERPEGTEDVKKWVPKKKHEVLKAKYKCLKKLFQIYDASVIGILPEPYPIEDVDSIEESETRVKKSKRKKLSTLTKSDACAGTTEISSGNITERSETEKDSTVATAVMRDLKMVPCSCTSTQFDTATVSKYASPEYKENDICEKECECTQTAEPPHPIPYLMTNERPRLTRFQSFIQRILGIRREYRNPKWAVPDGHIYAASDSEIMHTYGQKRRRRGLRFRRLRIPKKIRSESDLKNMRSPMILTCVQSVQRNCLMDTTPRHCPITGCRMVSYGIINYNDHLNLCHFTERKFICHYCHEGFEHEYDKCVHENEHLGINKLTLTSNPSSARPSGKKVSNTQTDPELTKSEVQEEKLKKIVSFFDKISDPDQVLSRIKKDRYSESNLHASKVETPVDNMTTTTDNSSDGDKRTVSCVNLRRKTERRTCESSAESDVTSKFPYSPVICHFCGENFDFRRQLSLHMDLEHRLHDKFSKFHSTAGIINPHTKKCNMHSEDGKINIHTKDRSERNLKRVNTSSTFTQDTEVTRRKSEESLSCDPSTNIVYYTSLDAVKPSIGSFISKGGYKWEPGTNIIRV